MGDRTTAAAHFTGATFGANKPNNDKAEDPRPYPIPMSVGSRLKGKEVVLLAFG
ncbi:glucosamine-6-phosphate deaminase, partial [Enterococcus faecium]|nr:glucosamine-6-phosphate deaminase [Enterococcus faecium]